MKYFNFLITLIFLPLMVNAQAVNVPFTYQGELTVNGSPANGTYDMSFDAYQLATDGTSLLFFGADIHANVTVTNGLFTVNNVDFGNLAFSSGPDVWIELAVKPVGTSTYTTLSPRQQITSTPYAIKADFSNNANTASDLNIAGATAHDVLVFDGSNWKTGGNKIRISSIGVSVGTTSVPPANGLRVGGVAKFDDDLNQDINKVGLPKYIVDVNCSNGLISVTGVDLTGNNGSFSITGDVNFPGYCTITFPTLVATRNWMVTANDSDGASVSCDDNGNSSLVCQRVDRQGNYQFGKYQIIIF